MAELTYLQAISDGLRTEMRRDKRVFLIGEDVGVYGGAFKVSLGFQEEFGPWRVIDAPLAEAAIIGGCTGAAILGMRPVAEMQFADFISCAWDQLVTVAAKQRWRAGTPVPMVVRLPSGGGFSGGPFHSQNPESSFAHIPGLKCVCPATPEDAKGLLISAIEKARGGGGPTLIECLTLRMEGHAVHDDAFYVPKQMFEKWAESDPIESFRTWLRANADLTDDEEDEIAASVKKLLVSALERAEESPLPDPATLTDGVYATPEDLDTPHHK